MELSQHLNKHARYAAKRARNAFNKTANDGSEKIKRAEMKAKRLVNEEEVGDVLHGIRELTRPFGNFARSGRKKVIEFTQNLFDDDKKRNSKVSNESEESTFPKKQRFKKKESSPIGSSSYTIESNRNSQEPESPYKKGSLETEGSDVSSTTYLLSQASLRSLQKSPQKYPSKSLKEEIKHYPIPTPRGKSPPKQQQLSTSPHISSKQRPESCNPSPCLPQTHPNSPHQNISPECHLPISECPPLNPCYIQVPTVPYCCQISQNNPCRSPIHHSFPNPQEKEAETGCKSKRAWTLDDGCEQKCCLEKNFYRWLLRTMLEQNLFTSAFNFNVNSFRSANIEGKVCGNCGKASPPNSNGINELAEMFRHYAGGTKYHQGRDLPNINTPIHHPHHQQQCIDHQAAFDILARMIHNHSSNIPNCPVRDDTISQLKQTKRARKEFHVDSIEAIEKEHILEGNGFQTIQVSVAKKNNKPIKRPICISLDIKQLSDVIIENQNKLYEQTKNDSCSIQGNCVGKQVTINVEKNEIKDRDARTNDQNSTHTQTCLLMNIQNSRKQMNAECNTVNVSLTDKACQAKHNSQDKKQVGTCQDKQHHACNLNQTQHIKDTLDTLQNIDACVNSIKDTMVEYILTVGEKSMLDPQHCSRDTKARYCNETDKSYSTQGRTSPFGKFPPTLNCKSNESSLSSYEYCETSISNKCTYSSGKETDRFERINFPKICRGKNGGEYLIMELCSDKGQLSHNERKRKGKRCVQKRGSCSQLYIHKSYDSDESFKCESISGCKNKARYICEERNILVPMHSNIIGLPPVSTKYLLCERESKAECDCHSKKNSNVEDYSQTSRPREEPKPREKPKAPDEPKPRKRKQRPMDENESKHVSETEGVSNRSCVDNSNTFDSMKEHYSSATATANGSTLSDPETSSSSQTSTLSERNLVDCVNNVKYCSTGNGTKQGKCSKRNSSKATVTKSPFGIYLVDKRDDDNSKKSDCSKRPSTDSSSSKQDNAWNQVLRDRMKSVQKLLSRAKRMDGLDLQLLRQKFETNIKRRSENPRELKVVNEEVATNEDKKQKKIRKDKIKEQILIRGKEIKPEGYEKPDNGNLITFLTSYLPFWSKEVTDDDGVKINLISDFEEDFKGDKDVSEVCIQKPELKSKSSTKINKTPIPHDKKDESKADSKILAPHNKDKKPANDHCKQKQPAEHRESRKQFKHGRNSIDEGPDISKDDLYSNKRSEKAGTGSKIDSCRENYSCEKSKRNACQGEENSPKSLPPCKVPSDESCGEESWYWSDTKNEESSPYKCPSKSAHNNPRINDKWYFEEDESHIYHKENSSVKENFPCKSPRCSAELDRQKAINSSRCPSEKLNDDLCIEKGYLEEVERPKSTKENTHIMTNMSNATKQKKEITNDVPRYSRKSDQACPHIKESSSFEKSECRMRLKDKPPEEKRISKGKTLRQNTKLDQELRNGLPCDKGRIAFNKKISPTEKVIPKSNDQEKDPCVKNSPNHNEFRGRNKTESNEQNHEKNETNACVQKKSSSKAKSACTVKKSHEDLVVEKQECQKRRCGRNGKECRPLKPPSCKNPNCKNPNCHCTLKDISCDTSNTSLSELISPSWTPSISFTSSDAPIKPSPQGDSKQTENNLEICQEAESAAGKRKTEAINDKSKNTKRVKCDDKWMNHEKPPFSSSDTDHFLKSENKSPTKKKTKKHLLKKKRTPTQKPKTTSKRTRFSSRSCERQGSSVDPKQLFSNTSKDCKVAGTSILVRKPHRKEKRSSRKSAVLEVDKSLKVRNAYMENDVERKTFYAQQDECLSKIQITRKDSCCESLFNGRSTNGMICKPVQAVRLYSCKPIESCSQEQFDNQKNIQEDNEKEALSYISKLGAEMKLPRKIRVFFRQQRVNLKHTRKENVFNAKTQQENTMNITHTKKHSSSLSDKELVESNYRSIFTEIINENSIHLSRKPSEGANGLKNHATSSLDPQYDSPTISKPKKHSSSQSKMKSKSSKEKSGKSSIYNKDANITLEVNLDQQIIQHDSSSLDDIDIHNDKKYTFSINEKERYQLKPFTGKGNESENLVTSPNRRSTISNGLASPSKRVSTTTERPTVHERLYDQRASNYR